jgi:hypothetical protein
MPDGLDDELERLRARAYGPDADIDTDPAALDRLRVLEDDARSATAAVPLASGELRSPTTAQTTRATTDAAAPSFSASTADDREVAESIEPVGHAGIGAGGQADEADGDADAWGSGIRSRTRPGIADQTWAPEASAQEPIEGGDTVPGSEPGEATDDDATASTPRPWWRTRRALAWMAAIAVVAVVGLATVVWSWQGQGRVALLQEKDLDGWPDNVMGEPPEDARLYEDYFGLTAVTMPQRWGSGDGMECLYIVESGGQGFMSTIGCAAGGFPPTAALLVSARGPDELRERFAEGTALQFVLRDGLVHVYADEP